VAVAALVLAPAARAVLVLFSSNGKGWAVNFLPQLAMLWLAFEIFIGTALEPKRFHAHGRPEAEMEV
jgi:hypothetical protein